MRAHGLVVAVPRPGPSDHVCWVYADDADLRGAVGPFVAGGLARGDRLLVVGDRMIDALHAPTLPFGGTDALIERGALETLTLTEAYDVTSRFVPEQQLAFYQAATRRALDDGFRGLRVVAEASALAADPIHRPELVRWEHLADDLAAQGSGFTAMCAYRGDLAVDTLTELATVHPLVRAPEGVPPFQVFFDRERVVLTGSLDTFAADRLCTLLAAIEDGSRTVLDIGGLDFVDVAGCRVLARWARSVAAARAVPELAGASRLVQRMWRLLALDQVAPVTFTEPRP